MLSHISALSRAPAAPPALSTLDQAKSLTSQLVAAVQAEYDRWDETDIDTYAGGGICHLIADTLVSVLDDGGITACTVSSNCEVHVYVACQLAEGVFTLDVPHRLYEVGGGYSWTKVPGIRFDASCLDWFRLSADPMEFGSVAEN